MEQSGLLPYFYAWYHDKEWPNGKATMYQSLKLRKAFNILAKFMEINLKDKTNGG
jgi:hypothetical protein